MRNLRGTYVHRGDAARRRRRIQQMLIACGFCATVWFLFAHRNPPPASAEPAAVSKPASSFFSIGGEARKLRQELDNTRGELSLLRAQYERAEKVIQYSSQYGITAALAGSIFDASLREGINPELAFRLVRLESEFNERA